MRVFLWIHHFHVSSVICEVTLEALSANKVNLHSLQVSRSSSVEAETFTMIAWNKWAWQERMQSFNREPIVFFNVLCVRATLGEQGFAQNDVHCTACFISFSAKNIPQQSNTKTWTTKLLVFRCGPVVLGSLGSALNLGVQVWWPAV